MSTALPDPAEPAAPDATAPATTETAETLEFFVSLHQPAPFVFETDEVLSLHFDILAVQSLMRRSAPDVLDLDYTRTMMGCLLLAAPPQRVLMIGLGGGSMIKYCHRHLAQTALTVVEIDPQVIALRERFMVPPDDARLQVLCADGADFLRQTDQRWDIIMVDGFTYDGQPPELCSPDFYADCHAALADNGLLVVNLQAESTECPLLEARLADAFDGQLLIVPSERGANHVVFAGHAPRWRPGPAELLARWKTLDAVHQGTLASVRDRLRQAMLQRDAG
ncbi:MAG: spermidine synthase [Pseudomonadota bacterium]|jgi:spermidine synthase